MMNKVVCIICIPFDGLLIDDFKVDVRSELCSNKSYLNMICIKTLITHMKLNLNFTGPHATTVQIPVSHLFLVSRSYYSAQIFFCTTLRQ